MGQEKTFSSALSNLAKMKTDAEKANEKVQAATDKAVAFAQSLKQGTNQAASAPAAPAKPAVPAAPARPAAPASFAKPASPAAPAKPASPAAPARPAAPAAPRPVQAAASPAAPAKPAAPAAPAKPAAPAAPAKPAASLKSLDEIAKLVIRGNYGNGEERKKRLIAEGYDYAQVQKRVNELLK